MKRKFFWLTAVFFLLCGCLGADNGLPQTLKHPQTGKPVLYSALPNDFRHVVLPHRYSARQGELRGVWVVTYVNMDFPRTANPEQFQRQYSAMLRQIRAAGFNAVFFQIRPSGDAFYNSALEPFSRFLCGEEGRGWPKFDLLDYMIREAHRQGLQFHAWMNPYRVVGVTELPKMQYLRTLSPKNFARCNPGLVLSVPSPKGNILLLDPGQPAVRRHLLATVQEIVQKYAPDSIHFDDYFYPSDYSGNADAATYRKYNRDPRLSIEDWRRQNVSQMVKEISQLIRSNNRAQHKNIRFGISPFGIWRNRASSPHGSPSRGNESYSSNYSDTRTWIRNNWIDYVIPQLYWKFTHPKAPYAGLADWWADTVAGTKVKLYIGHGAHLPFAANELDELKNQLFFNSCRDRISGSVFYSYRWIFQPDTPSRRTVVERAVRDCWHGVLPSPARKP